MKRRVFNILSAVSLVAMMLFTGCNSSVKSIKAVTLQVQPLEDSSGRSAYALQVGTDGSVFARSGYDGKWEHCRDIPRESTILADSIKVASNIPPGRYSVPGMTEHFKLIIRSSDKRFEYDLEDTSGRPIAPPTLRGVTNQISGLTNW